MASTFLGLEIGKRSLALHQTGLTVAGHNLTNADNDIYSRQRVDTAAMPSLSDPSLARAGTPGQIGQGAEVAAVRRDRDLLVDDRIHAEVGQKEFHAQSKELLKRVEDVHHALGDVNLQTRLDNFWSGWQELSKNPAEPAVRNALVQTSVSLTQGLRETFRGLGELRQETDARLAAEVNNLNDFAGAIARLNDRIMQSEATGDHPNDLLDQRDALVQKLAEIADVRVSYMDNDEVMVHAGGQVLVQGGKANRIDLEPRSADGGMHRMVFHGSRDSFDPKAGRLAALVEVRDRVLPDQIRRTDALAGELVQSVNGVHKEGFDLTGRKAGDFFTVRTAALDGFGNTDANRDGLEDSTFLSRLRGKNAMQGDALVGESGEITIRDHAGRPLKVPYAKDDRIADVVSRINATGANVNAVLDEEGRLLFKAVSNPERPLETPRIAHLEDSGRFLAGVAGVLKASGPAGAFTASEVNSYAKIDGGMERSETSLLEHAAAWIEVSSAIRRDGANIAAATGTAYEGTPGRDKSMGPGNGDVAKAISALRTEDVRVDGSRSFSEYWAQAVENLASRTKSAGVEEERSKAVVAHLDQVRKSFSGVNLDEEMTKMIAMQHGYQAAARIVKVMDEMLETIIVRMT